MHSPNYSKKQTTMKYLTTLLILILFFGCNKNEDEFNNEEYDYRDKVAGNYECIKTYSYSDIQQGSVNIEELDTLHVLKVDENLLRIETEFNDLVFSLDSNWSFIDNKNTSRMSFITFYPEKDSITYKFISAGHGGGSGYTYCGIRIKNE